MTARLAYANIFARDIVALSGFYAALFGFTEIESHRSPIYRCLDAGGVELGFNADMAFDLLGVADRRGDHAGLRVYVTFEVDSADAVENAARDTERLGGRVVKPPYDTYYNACQSVLEDPEGNIFRVNYRRGLRQPAKDVADPPWLDADKTD